MSTNTGLSWVIAVTTLRNWSHFTAAKAMTETTEITKDQSAKLSRATGTISKEAISTGPGIRTRGSFEIL